MAKNRSLSWSEFIETPAERRRQRREDALTAMVIADKATDSTDPFMDRWQRAMSAIRADK